MNSLAPTWSSKPSCDRSRHMDLKNTDLKNTDLKTWCSPLETWNMAVCGVMLMIGSLVCGTSNYSIVCLFLKHTTVRKPTRRRRRTGTQRTTQWRHAAVFIVLTKTCCFICCPSSALSQRNNDFCRDKNMNCTNMNTETWSRSFF